MSIISSYRLMGRFRHLRRVRGRVARYRAIVYGSALLLTVTVGFPLAFIGWMARGVADAFEGAADEWQGYLHRFLVKPYENRMGPFTTQSVEYMKNIDGPDA